MEARTATDLRKSSQPIISASSRRPVGPAAGRPAVFSGAPAGRRRLHLQHPVSRCSSTDASEFFSRTSSSSDAQSSRGPRPRGLERRLRGAQGVPGEVHHRVLDRADRDGELDHRLVPHVRRGALRRGDDPGGRRRHRRRGLPGGGAQVHRRGERRDGDEGPEGAEQGALRVRRFVQLGAAGVRRHQRPQGEPDARAAGRRSSTRCATTR